MTVDQRPTQFEIGQFVRVIDFQDDDTFGEGPRTNESRHLLIGKIVKITHLEYVDWRQPRAHWCVRLARYTGADPDLYWPLRWLQPVQSLARLAQRYKELADDR